MGVCFHQKGRLQVKIVQIHRLRMSRRITTTIWTLCWGFRRYRRIQKIRVITCSIEMRTVNRILTLENSVMGWALGSEVEVEFKGYLEMSERTDSEETDSEETDSRVTDSRVTDFQETDFQETDLQETDLQETDFQEIQTTTIQTQIPAIPTKSPKTPSSPNSQIMETPKATQTTQKFRVTVGSKTTKHRKRVTRK